MGKIGRSIFVVLAALSLFMTSASAKEDKSVEALIPVKAVGGLDDSEFTYDIKTDDPAHQVIENDSLTLKNGEEGYFKVLIDYPGEYHYDVSFRDGEYLGQPLDFKYYKVDVYVTEDDLKLSSEVVVYMDGSDTKTSHCNYDYSEYTKKYIQEHPEKQPGSGTAGTGGKGGTSGPAGNVKTGDDTNISLMLLICFASGVCLTYLINWIKKARKGRE